MSFKVEIGKGGLLHSTLAPVDRSREPKFGFWDALELAALVVGVILVVRHLLV